MLAAVLSASCDLHDALLEVLLDSSMTQYSECNHAGKHVASIINKMRKSCTKEMKILVTNCYSHIIVMC